MVPEWMWVSIHLRFSSHCHCQKLPVAEFCVECNFERKKSIVLIRLTTKSKRKQSISTICFEFVFRLLLLSHTEFGYSTHLLLLLLLLIFNDSCSILPSKKSLGQVYSLGLTQSLQMTHKIYYYYNTLNSRRAIICMCMQYAFQNEAIHHWLTVHKLVQSPFTTGLLIIENSEQSETHRKFFFVRTDYIQNKNNNKLMQIIKIDKEIQEIQIFQKPSFDSGWLLWAKKFTLTRLEMSRGTLNSHTILLRLI